MKVTVTNKLGWKRSVPMPNNTAVPIEALATVLIDNQPVKREKFFNGLKSYNFDIQLEIKPEELEQVDEVKNKEPKQEVKPEPPKQEVKPTPEPPKEDKPKELNPDEVRDSLSKLSVEQLKEMTSKLGIGTNSNKIDTLVNKIFDSTQDNLNKIMEVYKEVVK